MKNVLVIVASLTSILVFAQKPLKISSKSYNDKGLIVDKSEKVYSGKAKEKLKGSYLTGNVEKGKFVGTWELYEKKKLSGYHKYENEGNTTIAYDASKKLDWIETIEDDGKKVTEIKVDKNNDIEKLYILDYKKDGNHSNTFEYEKFTNNYYDVTIADYDYNSLTVVDFFKNNKGEEELVLRDFDKHHELIRVNSTNNHVKEIYFLGDILETPEDADYSLEKGFNASFTNLKDKDNFTLSLLTGKVPIFEIIVKNGHVIELNKVKKEGSSMTLYSKEKGYAPTEHQKALDTIKKSGTI